MALTHHKKKAPSEVDPAKDWGIIFFFSFLGFVAILAFTCWFFFMVSNVEEDSIQNDLKVESRTLKTELLHTVNSFYDSREASTTTERIGATIPVDPMR